MHRSQSVEMIALQQQALGAHVSGEYDDDEAGGEGFDIFFTTSRPLGGRSSSARRRLVNNTL